MNIPLTPPPSPSASAPVLGAYRFRTVDCDECGGHGRIYGFAHAVGEAFDGDYHEQSCDECNHTGETDAACADCRTVRPLDDEGFCEPCADASILSVDDWNAKHRPHLVFADVKPLPDGFQRIEL